ncbi:MAG: redoxin domain-containing protein [Candidatus Bathyarchaeia archaeon]|jgi:peroxiredoxin
MVNVKVGDKAPDFTLPDTNIKPRSLHDFLGKKIVLVFYVSAFTETCTKEVCTFRDSTDRFTDLDAQVIGVSVNDPFSNKEFAQKNRLPYPILSDYKREVIKKYGLEMPDYAGLDGYVVAKRSIFVVDQKGIIQYMWITENPTIEPNYEQIQQEIAKIPK